MTAEMDRRRPELGVFWTLIDCRRLEMGVLWMGSAATESGAASRDGFDELENCLDLGREEAEDRGRCGLDGEFKAICFGCTNNSTAFDSKGGRFCTAPAGASNIVSSIESLIDP